MCVSRAIQHEEEEEKLHSVFNDLNFHLPKDKTVFTQTKHKLKCKAEQQSNHMSIASIAVISFTVNMCLLNVKIQE